MVDKSTAVILEEKETEYQRNLRKLQNQVRTLQRILYHRDPTSLPTIMSQSESKEVVKAEPSERDKERQRFLEARISELENQLKFYNTRVSYQVYFRAKKI